MDFELTPEQHAIIEATRRFAQHRVRPLVRDYDREERFPLDLYAQLGELGLTGGIVPEHYGGAGMDHRSYALVLMELAQACQAMAAAARWASGVGRLNPL